ncbi:MAG: hypothetical protein KDK70_13870, partial [Myxococcales bacterium]|nr:hypothetical protein [Myxococcales bacterium]
LAPSPDPSSDAADPMLDPSGEGEGEGAATGNTERPDGAAAAPLPPPALPGPAPAQMAPQTSYPPRPIRWRLDFGVGFGSTLVSDLGYRAFSRRRHLPEITASTVFDFRLGQSRAFLGGGLAYQRLGRSDGRAYDLLDTDLTLHEPEVLGRVSVMIVEGLDAFARFGVGPSIVDLEFFGTTQGASQREVIPRVDAQGGLTLYLPKAWLARKQAARVAAGIELGLGYTWRGKIAVEPVLSQGDEPLRATTSPWGDLSMQGLSWRMGVFVRVM